MKESVFVRIRYLQRDARIVRLRTILFYLVLTIELLVEILAKSAYLYPYESYTFRLTFLLTLCVIILTDYTPKEYLITAAVAALGFLSYAMCGRNELLRFGLFIIACKGIDMMRALRYVFYVMLTGALAMMILSVTGIFGEVSLTADFRGYEETRYIFGMGHPNAFHCVVLMLSMLWMYRHREKMRLISYVTVLIIQLVSFYFSDSRTSLLVGLFMLVAFMLAQRYGQYRFYLYGSMTLYTLSILFSIWGATLWRARVSVDDLAYKMNRIITGRLNGLWMADENAMLWNWLPFSSPSNDAYFDMGWVRLAYWYGYIPAFIIVVVILWLITRCQKEGDASAIAWIVSASIYTIIEAHLVSVYIGRNYLLLLLGAYWYGGMEKKLPGKKETPVRI